MKKSLIALAVVASTVVFGSSMAANTVTPGAWLPNGGVGELQFGGTLTPQDKITPWEISAGAPVTNLDGFVQKGQQSVRVRVKNAIPVLGIRTQLKEAFKGQSGIAPQIDFKGAIDPAKFSSDGTATLTLDVVNLQSKKIGRLQVPLFAGAEYSIRGSDTGHRYMTARSPGDAFHGGLSQASEPAGDTGGGIRNRLANISNTFAAHYNEQSTLRTGFIPISERFSEEHSSYSSYYGSGIESGSMIDIRLDAPAASEAIEWRASLPVSVSYQ
ncbi:hypothetical protein XS28_22950 [Salmonella enterica subsp. enterica]|nr:hypothetical protein [Salmonella enterica subsp. enterica]EDV0655976.1 hypothetical protein [Salmonella enterica subsp. enterica]